MIAYVAQKKSKFHFLQIHKDYVAMETESYILNKEFNMSVLCMQYC